MQIEARSRAQGDVCALTRARRAGLLCGFAGGSTPPQAGADRPDRAARLGRDRYRASARGGRSTDAFADFSRGPARSLDPRIRRRIGIRPRLLSRPESLRLQTTFAVERPLRSDSPRVLDGSACEPIALSKPRSSTTRSAGPTEPSAADLLGRGELAGAVLPAPCTACESCCRGRGTARVWGGFRRRALLPSNQPRPGPCHHAERGDTGLRNGGTGLRKTARATHLACELRDGPRPDLLAEPGLRSDPPGGRNLLRPATCTRTQTGAVGGISLHEARRATARMAIAPVDGSRSGSTTSSSARAHRRRRTLGGRCAASRVWGRPIHPAAATVTSRAVSLDLGAEEGAAGRLADGLARTVGWASAAQGIRTPGRCRGLTRAGGQQRCVTRRGFGCEGVNRKEGRETPRPASPGFLRYAAAYMGESVKWISRGGLYIATVYIEGGA
jgi:hypothetical protein